MLLFLNMPLSLVSVGGTMFEALCFTIRFTLLLITIVFINIHLNTRFPDFWASTFPKYHDI